MTINLKIIFNFTIELGEDWYDCLNLAGIEEKIQNEYTFLFSKILLLSKFKFRIFSWIFVKPKKSCTLFSNYQHVVCDMLPPFYISFNFHIGGKQNSIEIPHVISMKINIYIYKLVLSESHSPE